MRRLVVPAAIVLVAIAVRLAVTGATGFSALPVKDELSYSEFAGNLAAGRGFFADVTRTVSGEPVTRRFTALRSPLYPALLAAVGGGAIAGRLLSCALGALTAGALFLWGRRLFPLPVAAVAATLLALWPSHVWASGKLLSEPLFVLLAVSAAAVLQARRPLAAGVLFGLAALARPAGLVFLGPAVLFVLLAWPRPRRWPLLLLVLPAVLTLAPWAARNASLHGRPLLTTNLGVTFLGGNNDLSLSSRWPGRWHLPEDVLDDDPPDMGYYGWSELTEAENDRRFLGLGTDWVRRHPDRWLRLLPAKAVRFLDPDQHSAKGDRAVKTWAGWLSFGVLLPFLAGGLVLALRRGRETLLLVGIPGMQLLLALVFYGDARMRLPAVPAMLLLGVAAAAWLVEKAARRSASRGASPGPPAA